MPTKQTMRTTSTTAPQIHICSTTMETPRRNPRAILRDSISSLVPEEGTGRAPSHAQDSDEATDNKRAFVLISEAEFKRAENGAHIATHPDHAEDVYGHKGAKDTQQTTGLEPLNGKEIQQRCMNLIRWK